MIWTAAYVAGIAAVNWSWGHIPPIWGDVTVGSIAVGFIFVLRDFAQEEVGHRRIWFAMVAGSLISSLGAPWRIAAASFAAFLFSEGLDWSVFTYMRRPRRERIVWSSVVGVPVDTLIFLAGIGALSWSGFVVMNLCKFVALAVLAAWPVASPLATPGARDAR